MIVIYLFAPVTQGLMHIDSLCLVDASETIACMTMCKVFFFRKMLARYNLLGWDRRR